MSPIAIQIGEFTIRWYGVMAAIGFLAASILINWNRKEAKLTSDQAANLVFIAMIAGVLGARIFYVIQFSYSSFFSQVVYLLLYEQLLLLYQKSRI